mmetsp:Transcript_10399/g.25057  ORF Transcript_10399/g.25057 Transcript_10399/m.25057 type:complete len:202 (+) Transcript_10399:1770-2375(+)
MIAHEMFKAFPDAGPFQFQAQTVNESVQIGFQLLFPGFHAEYCGNLNKLHGAHLVQLPHPMVEAVLETELRAELSRCQHIANLANLLQVQWSLGLQQFQLWDQRLRVLIDCFLQVVMLFQELLELQQLLSIFQPDGLLCNLLQLLLDALQMLRGMVLLRAIVQVAVLSRQLAGILPNFLASVRGGEEVQPGYGHWLVVAGL